MRAAPTLALALTLLASCSGPPLLSLKDRACDVAPRLGPGNDVTFGQGGSSTVTVDATSPCIETAAGRVSYAVFTLPASTGPYQITIRSKARGSGMISPKAMIYGAQGSPRREVDRFREEVGTLVASATGEPGDQYVVVTSTPATIGSPHRISTAANSPPVLLAATVVVPIILPAAPIGPTDSAIGLILAHSGTITVTAAPFVTVP